MSVVTGIFLCYCVSESPDKISKINRWLNVTEFSTLHQIDDNCCNGKHPQMQMFCGGYNYFPNEEFEDFIMRLDWAWPENVVLVLKPEDGPTRVLRPHRKST